MKHKNLRFGRGFSIVLGNRRSQAAQMVIEPGQSEGNARNRHDGADQWLFVVSGTGTALINRQRYPMRAGVLLLIERGDRHEIRNDGKEKLVTLNFYVPPAYSAEGDELPPGKPADHARSA